MPSFDFSTLVNLGLPVGVSALVALLVARSQVKNILKIEDRKLRESREREFRKHQFQLASLYSELSDAESAMWRFITRDVYGLVHAGKIPSEEKIREVQQKADKLFQNITSVSGKLGLLDPNDARVEHVWEQVHALDIALCRVRGLKPESEWNAADSYRDLGGIKHLGPEWTKKRNELLPRLRDDFAPKNAA